MAKEIKIIDGCTATTYIAYALSEVATIYPITAVTSMGELANKWGVQGKKNIFGQAMIVKELQSEKGASGATHGCLSGGALATTFTASQGLLLMIPNMYKIAGELLPGVFHIGTRSIAAHALSIFNDHSDVMACRQTGFAMLSSSSVQDCMDLGLVAHLAAIEGSIPFLHFFDGWRTSDEMHKIELIDYNDIKGIVNWDKINEFRKRAMNPEKPDIRGTAQGPQVFFQYKEATNPYYDALPDIVESNMRKVESITGRKYNLFDYVGCDNAEYVIISIGSSSDVIEETVKYLNNNGYKVGCIKVRLYRPFSTKHLLAAIPKNTKIICALDRTKESGANGEPLYMDVSSTMHSIGSNIKVIGGRYGLSSKDFTPSMVKAIFDNMKSDSPKQTFTIGIDDDITNLSIPVKETIDIIQEGTTECRFYGFGSDGSVGGCKQTSRIIGENTDLDVQAFFKYGPKKSGNYTVSELRFSKNKIKAAYEVLSPDYIQCHKNIYVHRFDVLNGIKENGTFVLNSSWTLDDMEKELPAHIKRTIANKNIKFYNIDANKIAHECGLGVRINMIMQTVFFKLTNLIDIDKAISLLKDSIKATYMHEGGEVVKMNNQAVDDTLAAISEIHYPDSWKSAKDSPKVLDNLPAFIKDIAIPIIKFEGDNIPVSKVEADGFTPTGTAAYEKRNVAYFIPQWDPDKCIQCCHCSIVCAHAAIRPYLATKDELKDAPNTLKILDAKGIKSDESLSFRIQVYPNQCLGCISCVNVCPGKALSMKPIAEEMQDQETNLEYLKKHVSIKDNLLARDTVKGSQLYQPLLEFSGACAGCGETPYVKLLTQLFGERLIIANATGCSSIWGASLPSMPYTVNRDGHGPAWANSLFEDNAEYGYGIFTAIEHRRQRLDSIMDEALSNDTISPHIKERMGNWKASKDDYEQSYIMGKELTDAIKSIKDIDKHPLLKTILNQSNILGRKSVWCVGGDGWAYDIDYDGIDHVLAEDENVKMLVLDTECYSNTGGQTSKATPLGAIAKYSASGKRTYKKELGRLFMTYENIYVASIALGANMQQSVNAIIEAENYEGPAIIIAYCPCINHGIRNGMGMSIIEEAHAVACGYWPLYRYNPELLKEGKDPLIIDYKMPNGTMNAFLSNEDRYADLMIDFPSEAKVLRAELQDKCNSIYQELTKDILVKE